MCESVCACTCIESALKWYFVLHFTRPKQSSGFTIVRGEKWNQKPQGGAKQKYPRRLLHECSINFSFICDSGEPEIGDDGKCTEMTPLRCYNALRNVINSSIGRWKNQIRAFRFVRAVSNFGDVNRHVMLNARPYIFEARRLVEYRPDIGGMHPGLNLSHYNGNTSKKETNQKSTIL